MFNFFKSLECFGGAKNKSELMEVWITEKNPDTIFMRIETKHRKLIDEIDIYCENCEIMGIMDSHIFSCNKKKSFIIYSTFAEKHNLLELIKKRKKEFEKQKIPSDIIYSVLSIDEALSNFHDKSSNIEITIECEKLYELFKQYNRIMNDVIYAHEKQIYEHDKQIKLEKVENISSKRNSISIQTN